MEPPVAAIKNVGLEAISPYLEFAEFTGTQRYRFSPHIVDNAIKAVSVLYCAHCANTFLTIIRSILSIYPTIKIPTRKILKPIKTNTSIDSTTHDSSETQSSDHKAPEYSPLLGCSVSLPALAFVLKKVDADLGALEGCYTLFNRLRLTSHPTAFDHVFTPRVTKWLKTVPEGAAVHAERLRPYIKLVLADVKQTRRVSFNDFLVSRSLWAGPGATDQKVPRGYSHSKGAWAFNTTDRDLQRWWLRHRDEPVQWRVFVKPDEVAAFRLIVNTDSVTYLKMAYASYLFEASLNSSELWAFANSKTKFDLLTTIMVDMAEGASGAAFDGSGWDESITHPLINVVVEEILKKVPSADPASGLATLLQQLNTATITLPTGESFVPVNGLASGLRWTTLINSVVNRALQYLVSDETGVHFNVVSTLGDDVVATTHDALDLEVAAKAYASAGFKLNVSKSRVAKGSVEFLKQHITHNRAAGVPLRALRAILFGSAELEMDASISVLNQRAALWAKYISRVSCNPTPWLQHVFNDAKGALHRPDLAREPFFTWLATSAALGGGGFSDKTEYIYRHQEVPDKTGGLVPVVRATDYWRVAPHCWHDSVVDRMKGYSNDKQASQTFTETAKLPINLRSLTFPIFNTLFMATIRDGVPQTAGLLHDSVEFTLKGVRTRREAVDLAYELRRVDPRAAEAVRQIVRSNVWSVASQILKGGLGLTGVSASTLFARGEMLAEVLAPFVVSTAMRAIPKLAKLDAIRCVNAAYLKLVAGANAKGLPTQNPEFSRDCGRESDHQTTVH